MNVNDSLGILKSIGIVPRKIPYRENLMKKVLYYRKLYFGKFHLESMVEEIQETRRILTDKNPIYKDVFTKQYNMNKIFLDSMRNHVENKSNAIIMTYGLPNSGKSEIGQSIAIRIIKNLAKRINIISNVNVIFEPSGLGKISETLNPVDQVILDEMPDLEGAGSVNYKKAMNNITKIVRQQQIFFYFTSPEMIKLKVVNYYIETYGKNKKLRITRCRLYDKKGELVGMIYLKLHDDDEFRKKYLEMKEANIKKLLKKGGKVVGKINLEAYRKDVTKVLEFARGKNIDKKEDVAFIVTDPDSSLDISGDTDYIKQVVQGSWIRIKKGIYTYKPLENEILEEQEENEDENEDEIDDELYVEGEPKQIQEEKTDIKEPESMNPLTITDDFPEFVLKMESATTTFQIAKCRSLLTSGQTYEEIKEKINVKSDDWVFRNTDTWKNPMEGGKKCDAWKLLEKWSAIKFGGNPNKTGGNDRKPDLEVNGMIFTIKWRYERGERIKFSQSKNFHPEYLRARELNKSYYLILYNPKWRPKRLWIIPIDPKSNDEVIIDKHRGRVDP